MQNTLTHKATNNQLTIRGHQQIMEPNSSLYKHKGSVGNPLNVSLGNWKNKAPKSIEPSKKLSQHDRTNPAATQHKIQKIEELVSIPTGEIDYKGMTLQQYFRVKSQQCKTQQAALKQNGSDNCSELSDNQKQLFGSLEINQTDEDHYNESQQSAQTPDFTCEVIKPNENNCRQQKILDKYTKGQSKLKTQMEEERDTDTVIYVNQNRDRLPTLSDSQTKTMRLEQQFLNKKKRTISNPHHDKVPMRFTFNDFYKFDKDSRNERAAQKAQVHRQRAAELKINELSLVTRYAQKFNINEAICRQIIRESKY